MRKELDFWKNKVSKLEEECYEKQNEIDELESDHEELKSDNENLKNEIEELEKKIIKAQSEIQEWHDEAIAVRKNRDEMLANFRKGIEPYVDLQDIHDKIAQLQDRHRQDNMSTLPSTTPQGQVYHRPYTAPHYHSSRISV